MHVRSAARGAETSPAAPQPRPTCPPALRCRLGRPPIPAVRPAPEQVRSLPPGVWPACLRARWLQSALRPTASACLPTRCLRSARPEASAAQPVAARVCSPSPYVLAACLLARLAEVARPEVSMGRPVAGWLQSTPLQLSADQRLERASRQTLSAHWPAAHRSMALRDSADCLAARGPRCAGAKAARSGAALQPSARPVASAPRPGLPAESSPGCFQRAAGSCAAARDGARARFPAPCRNRRP